MSKTITATYEGGVFRPVEPIELPEGTSVRIFVADRQTAEPWDADRANAILDEVAALSTEGTNDGQPVAREHDQYLYGDQSEFARQGKK